MEFSLVLATDMRQILTHAVLTAIPCVCGEGRAIRTADVVSGCPVGLHEVLPVWIHHNPPYIRPDVGEI
jgi:hypothetical protein